MRDPEAGVWSANSAPRLGVGACPLGLVTMNVVEMIRKVVLRDHGASLVPPVQVLMLSDVS